MSEACDAWLAYVAGEKDRRPSTVKEYRNTVRRYLVPEFGADTLVHTIDTERVDAIRERMLAEAQLSRRTIQKILVLLHGIHKRAKRKGWIATAGAQRPTSDPVARVLDALSRRQEGTRPDDLVFSPGFNVPFTTTRSANASTLRWRRRDSAGSAPRTTRSFSTTCGTRSGRWRCRRSRFPT